MKSQEDLPAGTPSVKQVKETREVKYPLADERLKKG
ncbi:uncharacterized protein J3R85_008718 [Psidium guajava]|nr:uncharacterized protein J3R85_008718 [Psidium guajava]